MKFGQARTHMAYHAGRGLGVELVFGSIECDVNAQDVVAVRINSVDNVHIFDLGGPKHIL